MERVTAYRFRGALYATRKDAERVIDDAIGAILTKHAHALARLDKYVAILEYLEANASDFAEVAALTDAKRVEDDEA